MFSAGRSSTAMRRVLLQSVAFHIIIDHSFKCARLCLPRCDDVTVEVCTRAHKQDSDKVRFSCELISYPSNWNLICRLEQRRTDTNRQESPIQMSVKKPQVRYSCTAGKEIVVFKYILLPPTHAQPSFRIFSFLAVFHQPHRSHLFQSLE